jgi:hypothetical protein
MMKFLALRSFASTCAIVSGVTASVLQYLLFESISRMIVAFGLTAAFAYLFARLKLKRMNLAPNCTCAELVAEGKNRRIFNGTEHGG